MTPVVRILLIVNGVMFLASLYYADTLITLLALWPLNLHGSPGLDALPTFAPYQLLTYAFLHGGVLHLVLNMYALWLFGSRMEYVWGSRNFAVYYFVCVIGAGLVQLFVATHGVSQGEYYPTVGASGGVFGLLLAFGMTFPNERLLLVFPPIAMKAKWFVIVYGLIELWAGFSGTFAGIAHFAHLGGMLFGFLLIWYWHRHPPRRR